MPDITDVEREFLIRSLWGWNGAASHTALPVRAFGFASLDEFIAETERLAAALEAKQQLDDREWGQAAFFAELSFASVFGCGEDWQYMGRLSDDRAIAVLRGIHRKIPETWVAKAFAD